MHAMRKQKDLTYLLTQINQGPKDIKGFAILDFSKAIAIVTAKLNKKFNVKNIGESTNQQLIERRDLLAQWIHDISKGNWDSTRLQ